MACYALATTAELLVLRRQRRLVVATEPFG
jgi:hypothetical protein